MIGHVGRDLHEDRVDLHEAARPGRLQPLGQANGVAAPGAPAPRPAAADGGGDRLDDAAPHQAAEDAPDRAV
jgi:hypothetical protein